MEEKKVQVRWVRTSDGRRGHRECWENYNAAISCGQESGDCRDPKCCFSESYVPPVVANAR